MRVRPQKIGDDVNYDVYIGRQISSDWKLKRSIFYNPYEVGLVKKIANKILIVNDLEESILFYWNMLITGCNDLYSSEKIEEIRKNIPLLRGKIFGCFCRNEVCHSEVLKYLSENWNGEIEDGKMLVPLLYDKMEPGLRRILKYYFEDV